MLTACFSFQREATATSPSVERATLSCPLRWVIAFIQTMLLQCDALFWKYRVCVCARMRHPQQTLCVRDVKDALGERGLSGRRVLNMFRGYRYKSRKHLVIEQQCTEGATGGGHLAVCVRVCARAKVCKTNRAGRAAWECLIKVIMYPLGKWETMGKRKMLAMVNRRNEPCCWWCLLRGLCITCLHATVVQVGVSYKAVEPSRRSVRLKKCSNLWPEGRVWGAWPRVELKPRLQDEMPCSRLSQHLLMLVPLLKERRALYGE